MPCKFGTYQRHRASMSRLHLNNRTPEINSRFRPKAAKLGLSCSQPPLLSQLLTVVLIEAPCGWQTCQPLTCHRSCTGCCVPLGAGLLSCWDSAPLHPQPWLNDTSSETPSGFQPKSHALVLRTYPVFVSYTALTTTCNRLFTSL